MMRSLSAIGLILCLVGAAVPAHARSFYNLPPHPEPHAFGNVVIDRTSSANNVQPVVFPHWLHRSRYTCSVCHGELEFEMVAGSTEITEADNREGHFCGACHDGTTAFSAPENCSRCHSGDPNRGRERFEAFVGRKPFAGTPFGNGIDWVKALRRGLITPSRFLRSEPAEMPFDKELLLQAEMGNIPPAIFPHRTHTEWMTCDTCHPGVFNIKAKTTKHFRMAAILKGQFCGACHLSVAFPMDDCARCHPGIGE